MALISFYIAVNSNRAANFSGLATIRSVKYPRLENIRGLQEVQLGNTE